MPSTGKRFKSYPVLRLRFQLNEAGNATGAPRSHGKPCEQREIFDAIGFGQPCASKRIHVDPKPHLIPSTVRALRHQPSALQPTSAWSPCPTIMAHFDANRPPTQTSLTLKPRLMGNRDQYQRFADNCSRMVVSNNFSCNERERVASLGSRRFAGAKPKLLGLALNLLAQRGLTRVHSV